MNPVDAIYDELFSRPRDPRSAAYRAGVRAALAWRLEGARVQCPYPPGSAEADAYFAGTDEGHAAWRARAAAGRAA